MKKRIIGLLLVVVILVLSLASCAYSYEKDDLTQYATFDKAGFESAIAALVIEDGDFSADETTRAAKVEEKIYTTLSDKADKDNKLKTGTPGAHDVVYYCFHATATFGEETVYLFTSSMKDTSASKIQLGSDLTGTDATIAEKLAIDFEGNTYTSRITGKAADGDLVYVSYTAVSTVTGADDVQTEKTVNVSNKPMTLRAGDALSDKFIDLDVAKTLDEFEIEGVTYKNAKVSFVVDGGTEYTFTATPYTEKKETQDESGVTRNLENVELTYHVYPVYYLAVGELNFVTLVEKILGTNLTETSLPIFTDEEYTKDEKTLGARMLEIVDYVKARDTAKSSVTTAESTVETKKAAVETEKGKATEAEPNTEAIASAETALTTAEEDLTKKQGELTTAQEKLDEQYAALETAIPGVKDKIVENYRKTVYDGLLESYNSTIKTNLATEVWKLIEEKVNVNGTPDKAVKEAYDNYIDDYKNTFYTGSYDDSESNYHHYNGNFNNFLIATTVGAGSSLSDAKAEVEKQAKEYVEPILRMYVVAKAYNCVLTDGDVKEISAEDGMYSYYSYYYGEDAVKIAYQFNKIMDTILESETDEDGNVTYTKVKFSFGEEN